MISSIQISKKTKDLINELKNKGETYEDTIKRLCKIVSKKELKQSIKLEEDKSNDELNKEYIQAQEKIRVKLRSQNLSEDQVQIKMNEIDMSFFKHLWINGADFTKKDIKDRLRFYTEYLEIEFNN